MATMTRNGTALGGGQSGCSHLDNAEAISYPSSAEHRAKFQAVVWWLNSECKIHCNGSKRNGCEVHCTYFPGFHVRLSMIWFSCDIWWYIWLILSILVLIIMSSQYFTMSLCRGFGVVPQNGLAWMLGWWKAGCLRHWRFGQRRAWNTDSGWKTLKNLNCCMYIHPDACGTGFRWQMIYLLFSKSRREFPIP